MNRNDASTDELPRLMATSAELPSITGERGSGRGGDAPKTAPPHGDPPPTSPPQHARQKKVCPQVEADAATTIGSALCHGAECGGRSAAAAGPGCDGTLLPAWRRTRGAPGDGGIGGAPVWRAFRGRTGHRGISSARLSSCQRNAVPPVRGRQRGFSFPDRGLVAKKSRHLIGRTAFEL